MTQRRKIRWLIAHYPAYLFIRTAKKFTEELEKLCPGQFQIEIHTIDTYVDKYHDLHEMKLIPPDIAGLEEVANKNDIEKYQVNLPRDIKTKWDVLFDALREGKFELSQTQINIIGSHLHKNFGAIDLPFLFNDHDHVSRVLDNEIGDELCEQLATDTDIRGLGFTYSGGYRVIGASHEIKDLSELTETKLLTTTHPSFVLFKEIGGDIVSRGRADINDLGDLAEKGAVETTYLRFTGKHILKTDHSMFMTSILTGSKFWDSLTVEQQQAFKIAAKTVAQTERSWSVEDANKYEKDAESKGIKIVDVSDEDRAKLKKAAHASYRAVKAMGIDPQLVKRIIEKGDVK
jgi:TRAP-type C4-dicarboxylate transport system substrate-binding protein